MTTPAVKSPATAPAPMTPRIPRIVTLTGFLAGIVWFNRTAPEMVPAILLLVLLYAGLTHLDRVDAVLGGFETSVARGFATAGQTK